MDKNPSFISRLITGVKNGSSLRPTVTPDMISYLFIEHNKMTGNSNNKYYSGNIGNNFYDNNDSSNSEYPSTSSMGSSTNSVKIKADNLENITESHLDYLNSDLKNFRRQDIVDKKTLGKNTVKKKMNSDKYSKIFGSLPEEQKTSPVSDSQKIGGDLFSVKGKAAATDRIEANVSFRRDLDPLNQQNYITQNAGIETENIYRNILEKLKKSDKLKVTSEPSITVNVGKITVRAVNDSRSSSHVINRNESRQSKKLSLTDYLRKRAEKM